jgi:hypothetical protein
MLDADTGEGFIDILVLWEHQSGSIAALRASTH